MTPFGRKGEAIGAPSRRIEEGKTDFAARVRPHDGLDNVVSTEKNKLRRKINPHPDHEFVPYETANQIRRLGTTVHFVT